jgi:CheY-like chemotaxis protein
MLKVLIAEDDLMIADIAEEMIVGYGYEVCGVARTVEEAVDLGRLHKPDLALIDLRLADEGCGTDIVAQLGSLENLGILYASGNIEQFSLTASDGHACLAKPYRSVDLQRGLEIVATMVATGVATPPFPLGFHVLPPTPAPQSESSNE